LWSRNHCRRLEEEALALAAAIEGDSEHMIARRSTKHRSGTRAFLPSVSDFEAIKGRGVQANVDGKTVYVGGPRLLEMLDLEPAG
jgi:P-type Cu2+ transporter